MLSKARGRLIRRLRTRRGRPREGLFLVEGLRAVEEVLEGGVEVSFAAVSSDLGASERGRGLEARLREAGVELESVDAKALEELSDTESPQGVLLVCRQPERDLADLSSTRGRGVLVLDAVQDPGNLGTLVRAARAFGLRGVVALDGTVDPWNPKSVRASAGASFRLPVVRADWGTVEPWLAATGLPLLASDAEGVDVADVKAPDDWVLAVGNEGSGVRRGVREVAREVISIPMAGGVESLNAGVAGAVLLYALTRPGGG